jgi:hypothetical protein
MAADLFGWSPLRSNVFTYNGIFVLKYTNYAWGDNVLHVRNTETGKVEEIGTATFVVDEFGQGGEMALIGWRNGGEDNVRVVDEPRLETERNFDEWYKTHKPKI